jgi:hypothetical protein
MRTTARNVHFAICLVSRPEDDLQVGKVYRVVPDKKAAEVGCFRVVDESGEDNLWHGSAKHDRR